MEAAVAAEEGGVGEDAAPRLADEGGPDEVRWLFRRDAEEDLRDGVAGDEGLGGDGIGGFRVGVSEDRGEAATCGCRTIRPRCVGPPWSYVGLVWTLDWPRKIWARPRLRSAFRRY